MLNPFRRRHRKSHRKQASRPTRRRMKFEPLEGRQMMAGDVVVDWNDGVIKIIGTDEADIITISDTSVNGQRALSVSSKGSIRFTDGERLIPPRAVQAMKSFTIQGLGGNDVIINNTTIPMTIGGDDGNDTIVGGDGNDILHGGRGEDIIEGGAGNDKIYGESDNSAGMDGNFGRVIGVGDFDGDRDDDVLFKDPSGGLVMWRMENGRAVDTKAVPHDSKDQYLGTGDLDGDGDHDLLFVRKSNDSDNGLLITYVMQGGNLIDTRAKRSEHGYLLGDYVGMGDFNGDGRDSVLTRRKGDWLLIEYTTDSSGVPVDRSGRMKTDSEETILGIGKIDGGSSDDLMTFRERDNRLISYTKQFSQRNGAGYKDGQDTFLGFGNFVAGNGRQDELLMRRSDGRYIEYVFNAQGSVADIRGAGLATNFSGGDFQLLGNFNGDDFTDALWREPSGRLVTQVFGYGAFQNGLTYADVRDGREAGYAVAMSGFDDDLHGGDGMDILDGGLGRDLLRGRRSENDLIVNYGGIDDVEDGVYRARLNTGLKVTENRDGVLRLDGTDFDDVIVVTQCNGQVFIPGVGYLGAEYRHVEIRGLGGNDWIVSRLAQIRQNSSAGVILSGNAGHDVLIGGAADDAFLGGLDNDVLMGGLGIDTVDFSHHGQGVYVHLGNNRASGEGEDDLRDVENVTGTEHADMIFGDSRGNRLNGNGGDDQIDGNAGDDLLIGGAGNDRLNGGAGLDTIDFGNAPRSIYVHLADRRAVGDGTDELLSIENVLGSQYDDMLLGDGGDNTLEGLNGDDEIDGNAGNDVVVGGNGDDQLNGGDDNDTVRGGDGDDFILGGEGGDVVEGNDGHDLIWGGTEDDWIQGGNGDDFIHGEDGNDSLFGESGNDSVLAGSGNDHVVGSEGADVIFGGSGEDVLLGDDGDDFIFGEFDNDFVHGGAGHDYLDGGEGATGELRDDDEIEFEMGLDTVFNGDGGGFSFGINFGPILAPGLYTDGALSVSPDEPVKEEESESDSDKDESFDKARENLGLFAALVDFLYYCMDFVDGPSPLPNGGTFDLTIDAAKDHIDMTQTRLKKLEEIEKLEGDYRPQQ